MGCSHNADVAINSRDSLIRPGFEELAGDDFLHGQDDTVLASNADSCAAVLDCLYGVLDLSRMESVSGMKLVKHPFWGPSYSGV